MNRKTLALIVMASMISLSAFAQEKVITGKEIPGEITAYITKYFPGQKLLHAVKDRDDLKVKYEILLEGRTKLEFNQGRKVTEITSGTRLPDAVIPAEILAYVKANYPDHFINEWEKEKRKQTVELDNDLSLEFDLKGKFLRIDD
jgi:hypothetical protein